MVNVIFVQPFTVGAQLAEQCGERVVVLDVAFNAGAPAGRGTPQEQFENTTVAFIEALGDRLALWLDHHPHRAWSNYTDDPRFILVSREEAPACPPLVTPELVAQVGEVDTIIAHGDFDGIMSAVKFALAGQQAYPEMDADSIAADSRVGQMSVEGRWMESALKSDLRDDIIRQALFTYLTWKHGDDEDEDELHAAQAKIEQAADKYAAIQTETHRLATLYTVAEKVAYVDATGADGYDLTVLLLAGQKQAQVAVVRNLQRGNAQITIAGPKGWDFVKMFGLTGGMPNRVNLPDGDMLGIIETINQ